MCRYISLLLLFIMCIIISRIVIGSVFIGHLLFLQPNNSTNTNAQNKKKKKTYIAPQI